MSGTFKAVNPPAVFKTAVGAHDFGAASAPDATVGDSMTSDSLLDGRVAYRQFRHGHRTGLEPVLMAAFVPARPGQCVLEAGCGAGAGLLCLGARVPGLSGVGLEGDGATAALARMNLAANGFGAWPVHHTLLPDVSSLESSRGTVHHVFANPPWHRAQASVPDQARRRLARTAPDNVLDIWIGALRPFLRHRGTLTLALPSALMDSAFTALRADGFGSAVLVPLWPKTGRAARLCLIRAVLGGRGDAILAPGLVLHDQDGRFTDAADAILRDGAALAI